MELLRDPIWQFIGVVVAILLFFVPVLSEYWKRRTKGAANTLKVTKTSDIPVAQELKESRIGQYEVVDTISQTSLSIVWRVKSLNNGRAYILKQNRYPSGYDLETIHKLKGIYESGAETRSRVALPLETVRDNDALYEILEPVEGLTLEELVRINPNQTVYGQLLEDWAKELLDLLIPLHAAGYVHRDISPYNIIVARETLDLVLIDFSNAVHQKPNKKPSLIECPGFSAPELREGKYYPSSDLYSVGAVLAYLNTGRHPPTVEDRMYRGREISLHDIRGRRLAQAIVKMLALDPNDRFQDAAEARAAIQRHGSTELLVASPENEFLLGDGTRLMLHLQRWRRV